MLNFSEYLQEGTNLGSKELSKPNSVTGEKRTNIFRKMVKGGVPFTLVKGGKFTVSNVKSALAALKQYEHDEVSFSVLDQDGNPVKITQISKSTEFGGGVTGAGAGTKQTAIAESAQCVWLQAMLDNGMHELEYFTDSVLKHAYKNVDVDSSLNEILAVDDTWKISSFLSAKLLIKEGYVNKGMEFHRGSKTMKLIYNLKDQAFKNNDLSKFTDDKWNPGDIWAVKKGFNIKKELKFDSVKALQRSILKHFVDRNIVAISLKKITKAAKAKEYNISLPPDTDDYKLKEILIMSKTRGTFWSSKAGSIIYDSGAMEVKANSSYGSSKVEIKGKGARGGGAGWGYIKDAAKQALKFILPETRTMVSNAKKILKGDTKEMKRFYQLVANIDPNLMHEEEFNVEIRKKDGPWIAAKLAVCHLISMIKDNHGVKANRYITKLINYAGSKTEDSSTYVKIHEA